LEEKIMANTNDRKASTSNQGSSSEQSGERRGTSQADEGAHYAAGSGRRTTGRAENIRERMDVIASCGKKIGVVDRVEEGAIKLTKNDSPDGEHHFIPLNWVERVDKQVHLSKDSEETEHGWKPDAASCACD
jgi:hypothetical protein